MNYGYPSPSNRHGESCWDQARMIYHQIGHALGLPHEHNRPDRDEYIKIYWENVAKEKASEFQKVNSSGMYPFIVPYDMNSIMHVKPTDFQEAHKGHSFMPKYLLDNVNRAFWRVRLRELSMNLSKAQFSPTDFKKLNTLYHCHLGGP